MSKSPKELGEEIANEYLRPIEEALDSKGLTPEYLARKLKDELNALTQRTYFNKKTGKVVYSNKMIDWKTRQQAREDAHKLRGDYAPEKQEHTGQIVSKVEVEFVKPDEDQG